MHKQICCSHANPIFIGLHARRRILKFDCTSLMFNFETQSSVKKKLPGRVFCKKGCDADGETWDECLGECDEICYKDPVLKDQKWSAYIDVLLVLPATLKQQECFRACVAGCGYKFDIPAAKINQVHSRPPKPPNEEKPAPPPVESRPPHVSNPTKDEIPSTSA